MSDNFVIRTLKNKDEWYQQFNHTKTFIINSNDKLADSYKHLWNTEVKEATILFYKNEIICLSFFIQKKYWRSDVGELLNRFWLNPSYRGFSWLKNHPISSKLGINSIGELMLQKQLDFAISNNYRFVFVSRKYPAINWQESFIKKFNNWNWISYPKLLWEVRSNLDIKNTWETCVWLNLQNTQVKTNKIEIIKNYAEFPVFKFTDSSHFPLFFTTRELYRRFKL